MNREDALARFIEMLQNALRVQTTRVKTRIPTGSRTQRLEAKKKRAETKQSRSTKVWD
jgi:ribosome-associated protein